MSIITSWSGLQFLSQGFDFSPALSSLYDHLGLGNVSQINLFPSKLIFVMVLTIAIKSRQIQGTADILTIITYMNMLWLCELSLGSTREM